MNLNKLKVLLEGGLWFARLDQFRTVYEGQLPKINRIGLLSMLPPAGAAWVEREYKYSVLRSFASCWHANDGDPRTEVWRDFDKRNTGVAIRTSARLLRGELSRTCAMVSGRGPIHFGAVRYINHSKDRITDWNVLHAAFAVRKKWGYQQEARVLIHTHGTAASDHLYGKTGFHGKQLLQPVIGAQSSTGRTELIGGYKNGRAIALKVDPKQLILEIVPNPAMTRASRSRLLRLAKQFGLAGRVRAMKGQ